MYTKLIDYLEVSSAILERLEMEYKYAAAKAVDKPQMIKFLADQLECLSLHEVMGWNGALDMIATEGRQHPPTVPEILASLRKNGIANIPEIKRVEDKTDYMQIWKSSNDKGKFRFFIDNCHVKVPPFIRRWAMGYYVDEYGWTRHEAAMWIKICSNEDPKSVVQYFIDRQAA